MKNFYGTSERLSPKVAAVVVTHNSESTLERCLKCLNTQNYPLESVIVVDSGSSDLSYLEVLQQQFPITLLARENIGFSHANNFACKHLPDGIDFVMFVNPDTFLFSDSVSKAVTICEQDTEIGILSGKLLGYSAEEKKPTGRIDSTGIFRKWYGRWYDRGQGDIDCNQYSQAEIVPALCGALLFCRNVALSNWGNSVFDPDFFLYKEDIELCLRVRKAGWKLLYNPEIKAYHCRGWQRNRSEISLDVRKLAAKSELLLYKKHPSPYYIWALFKYMLVKVFRI